MAKAHYDVGSYVWITDDKERFLPAQVKQSFAPGEAASVLTDDGEKVSLTPAQSALTTVCNPEAMNASIEDLINISDLNEMAILHMLRIRFRQDKIYTNISSILVSVNPFKQLPLYTPEMLDKYRNGTRNLPPHVFATAYSSYHNMLSDSADQSVVISGESGAGKSEATKLILQFLTDVSSRQGSQSSGDAAQKKTTLEQQILAANPILEAFGNAKTLRNNNSSRFGKLITVNFDKNGSITGGGIINYLLEKSRVVTQTVGERNYHIFYQLLSAAATNPQLTADLKLQDPAMFDYTNPNHQGVATIDGVKDDIEFEDLQNSLDILHFSKTEQADVFKIVAGVLHFGNIKFGVNKNSTGDDGSVVTNKDSLTTACRLWGVSADQLEKFLTHSEMSTGGEKILRPYNVQQAKDARDAMVKKVYCDLFQWTVDKINRELSSGGVTRHRFIGVLDIFGFESFLVNSFEQLCINFCNETLQFHFNEHIFKMEQTLYAAEGIVIAGSTFVDNQPTLDLLELKTTGIFSMVDEEISVPKGSDMGFLGKVLKRDHPNLLKPKTEKDCKDPGLNFGVLHYAGPVYYNVTNFLDKNKDTLHDCIVGVLKASSVAMIVDMFGENADATHKQAGHAAAPKAGTKKPTLGGQFKTQLNDLIATLNATHPHFVRCMKSNDEKKGNIFAAGRMQDQLRYAGLVEVCRIRKLGYPVRRPFDEFFKRFRCCFLTASGLDNLTAFLVERGVLKQGEWAKGHSKIFMRTLQASQLEVFREQAFQGVAVVAQKYVRRFICRRKLRRFKKTIADLKDAITKRDEKSLTVACENCGELPYFGAHLAVVKQAKALLARVKEENKVTRLLQNAIDSHDLNALKGAVSAAQTLNPPFQSPLIAQATEIITRLEAELACKAGLTKAINERNLAALSEFLGQAAKIGLKGPEVEQATALKARIEEEDHAISALNLAVSKKSLADINHAMSVCVELGIVNRPEVVAAAKQKDLIVTQMASDKAAQEGQERQRASEQAANAKRQNQMGELGTRLASAISARNQSALNSCLQEAIQAGLQSPQVAEAQKLLSQLNVADEARSQLAAAILVLKTKSESGLVDADLGPLSSALASAEQTAKSSGLGEFSELVDARAAFASYTKQAQLWIDLKDGVKNPDRIKLKAALDAAENERMQVEIMADAKALLRELELQYRAERAAAGESLDEDQPYDAAEEARKQRQETARQAKYEMKNFAGLRSEDDFAKGSILNKSKTKEGFLNHQVTPIPKSISQFRELPKENSKKAVEIHRNLLGYMGDKQMPFPAMLAQDVLRKGFENKAVRDEIYIQLIKQLTNNPRPESVAKGWQLMCMCVGTFPPSMDFEMYLMHYILEKRDKGRGAVVDYAKYCLRTLEAMLSHGENVGFVPDVPEITAYKERPPILASVSLVDGAVLVTDLPITPDTNVGKILEMCANWLALRDPRIDSLGLFVYDLGETEDAGDSGAALPYADLERTPRPLRNDDYMGDVVVQKARQRRKFKFVLKNKIFLPQNNVRGDDPGYERMIYLQCEDEVIIQGNLEMAEEADMVRQASISLAVCFGEDMGADEAGLIDNKVIDFVAPAWRERRSETEWARLLLKHRPSLMPPGDIDVDAWYSDLQAEFVSITQKHPYYGTHWFYVHKMEPAPGAVAPELVANWPKDLLMGFNHVGLHMFTMEKKLLSTFSYGNIYRWGGSSSQFSLIMADTTGTDSFEFVVVTAQAADMAASILDHIHALMRALEAGGAPAN